MPQQTDLFGREPSQRELFRASEARPNVKPVMPESVRERMLAMLAELRASDRMPWPERKVLVNQVIFPQMAHWLSDEEASQVCFQFAQELERLNIAA